MLKKSFNFFLETVFFLVFCHLVPYLYSALASQVTSGASPIPSHYSMDKDNSDVDLPLVFFSNFSCRLASLAACRHTQNTCEGTWFLGCTKSFKQTDLRGNTLVIADEKLLCVQQLDKEGKERKETSGDTFLKTEAEDQKQRVK